MAAKTLFGFFGSVYGIFYENIPLFHAGAQVNLLKDVYLIKPK